MKKLLAIVLTLCLMCGLLAACGSNDKDGSSSTPSGDSAEVVDIAEFEGVWKTDKVDAAAFKISAADSSVTTYAENGYPIATFPCVATAEGLVLKMGAFGEVTIKEASELTITAEPIISEIVDIKSSCKSPSYEEKYLNLEAYDVAANKGTYKGVFQNEDYGTYTFSADKTFIEFSPTKNLMSHPKYEILAGGKVFVYAEWKDVFVEEGYFSTDEGKAMGYYCTAIVEEFGEAEFDAAGKFLLSGEAMGVWYPTATGITIEYTDGTTEEVDVTKDSITVAGMSFTKVAR